MTARGWLAFSLASLALHASVGAALGRSPAALVEPPTTSDAWVGGGGDAVELIEAPAEEGAGADAPPSPPPEPATAAEPAAVDAAGSTSAKGETSRPTPKRTKRARPRRAVAPATASPGAPATSGHAGDGSSQAPQGFGSERAGAPRDLLRALTRAIAPANQADPAWSRVAAGRVLVGELTFELDADGHVGSSSASPSTAPELAELLRRTTFLLKGGTFAPRGGAAAAGTLRYSVRASVTDTGLPDAEGGAIELSFDVSGGVGHAAFVRAGGRRVDVELRPLAAR